MKHFQPILVAFVGVIVRVAAMPMSADQSGGNSQHCDSRSENYDNCPPFMASAPPHGASPNLNHESNYPSWTNGGANWRLGNYPHGPWFRTMFSEDSQQPSGSSHYPSQMQSTDSSYYPRQMQTTPALSTHPSGGDSYGNIDPSVLQHDVPHESRPAQHSQSTQTPPHLPSLNYGGPTQLPPSHGPGSRPRPDEIPFNGAGKYWETVKTEPSEDSITMDQISGDRRSTRLAAKKGNQNGYRGRSGW